MKKNLKFKEFRKKIGLSKNRIHEEIGCSRTIVMHWDNGYRNPSLKNCDKLVEMALRYGLKITKNDLRDFESRKKRICIIPYKARVKKRHLISNDIK